MTPGSPMNRTIRPPRFALAAFIARRRSPARALASNVESSSSWFISREYVVEAASAGNSKQGTRHHSADALYPDGALSRR
jgi:hypothetical protein